MAMYVAMNLLTFNTINSSLADAMVKAKSQGWFNCTSMTIHDKLTSHGATTPRFSRRSEVTPIGVFLRLITPQMLAKIAADSNEQLKGNTKVKLTKQDIKGYVSMIVECCGTQTKRWGTYLREKNRVGLERRRYELLRGVLVVNTKQLYTDFTSNTHSITTVAGESAIDETMLPYEGKTDHSVFIPRKPHNIGIRLYLHCFRLSSSDLPLCFSVVPDTEEQCIPSNHVLERMNNHLPVNSKVSITCDSFFSSLGWLESHPNRPTLFSLNSNDLSVLLPLFRHKLKFHEFRMFTNNKIIVSLWMDSELVVCATNRFRMANVPDQKTTVGVNMTGYDPICDQSELQAVANLKIDTLKEIAKRMGESQSKQ